VTTAPLLSAVVAVADALASRFGFPMDLGAGSCDGNEEDVFVAACAKLNLDLGAMSVLEKEARQVPARVDEALKHKPAPGTEEAPLHTKETKSSDVQSVHVPVAAKATSSARKHGRSLFGRMWQGARRLFG
jgi:hypothetical protein